MRFSIQKKVVFLGVGLSFVLMGVAFLVSFLVFRSNAKKNLISTVDSSVEELETRLSTDEGISQLNTISSYLIENYEKFADQKLPEFKSPKEEYEYYEKIYNTIYFKPTPGSMGMFRQIEKTYVQEISSALRYAVISSRGVEAYVCYYDLERDRWIYMADSVFDFNSEYLGAGHLFGSYYTLKEDDVKSLTEGEEYKEYDWDNKKTRYISIYDDNNEQAYVATIFIEYNEEALYSQLNNFLIIESIAFGVALIVLITMYVILARYFLVKNIEKLNSSTKEFTKSLYDENEILVLNPNVKAKDEIGALSDSFVTLEKEIINYTKKIKTNAIEKEKMNAELSIASKIQLESLPKGHINDPKVLASASISSAKEVGGDFYDYFYLDDNHLAIIIADVSGKGIPASLFMMRAKELIKSKLLSKKMLEEVLYEVNNELLENNEAGLFITSFIGILDLDKRVLNYINAGHERPYIIGDKVVRLNPNSNFILGGLKDFKYVSEKINLKPNDRLFLYTDGLNESINNNKEEFGYERIEETLNANKNEQLSVILKNMEEALNEFTKDEEAFDDVTMLIVELKDSKLSFHFDSPSYEIIENVTNKFNDYYSYLDKSVISNIDIIFDELLNNYISYDKKDDLIIELNIEVKNDKITLLFRNNGIEFNPLLKEDKYIKKYSSDLALGGFGISIVKNIASDIKYERKDGFNILKIVKKL